METCANLPGWIVPAMIFSSTVLGAMSALFGMRSAHRRWARDHMKDMGY